MAASSSASSDNLKVLSRLTEKDEKLTKIVLNDFKIFAPGTDKKSQVFERFVKAIESNRFVTDIHLTNVDVLCDIRSREGVLKAFIGELKQALWARLIPVHLLFAPKKQTIDKISAILVLALTPEKRENRGITELTLKNMALGHLSNLELPALKILKAISFSINGAEKTIAGKKVVEIDISTLKTVASFVGREDSGIKKVTVSRNNITPENFIALAPLVENSKVQRFGLSENREFGTDGLNLLILKLLSPNSSITALQLNNCGINKLGALLLWQYLKNPLCRLERLDIAKNILMKDGVHFLAEAFLESGGQSLKELNLSSVGFEIKSSEFPAVLLRETCNLESLNLTGNVYSSEENERDIINAFANAPSKVKRILLPPPSDKSITSPDPRIQFVSIVQK